MIKIGDFVSARIVEQGSVRRKEGVYLRKNSNTVTIDLVDADTLAKLNSGEITELDVKPNMLYKCWLNGATLADKEDLPAVTQERLTMLRAMLRSTN